MLSVQKSPTDKTGLEYVAPPSDIPSTSMTVFVKPIVHEPPFTVVDKGKDIISGDIPVTQKLPTIRRPPTCHHCNLSRHVRPQCSLLKAQRSKVEKEVPGQAHFGTRPLTQHKAPRHQAPPVSSSMASSSKASGPMAPGSPASAEIYSYQSEWQTQG
jgi:hypothetical protein